jgi:radical SAM protein with 4Fe4S-binding SPASM domain
VLDIIQYAYQCSRFTDTKIVVTGEIIDINEDDVENLKHFQYADEIELWRPHNWASWGEYRSGDIVKTTCGRPFNGPLQIQVDGTVNMCCFDFNGDLEIGDLKTQTIEEIFTSDAYMEIYNHHKNGTVTESNLLCKNCDQLKDSGSVLVYSTKGDDRVGKLSTTYKSLD